MRVRRGGREELAAMFTIVATSSRDLRAPLAPESSEGSRCARVGYPHAPGHPCDADSPIYPNGRSALEGWQTESPEFPSPLARLFHTRAFPVIGAALGLRFGSIYFDARGLARNPRC